MKKLGKLSINPSKVMKNEELVNLKGGYGGGYGGDVSCVCKDFYGTIHYQGSTTWDCGCYAAARWIRDMCWPQHQQYSYCNCNPCL
ncbi:MAG: hypothetical protein ACOZDD_08330 [Bacteroidota bacterium]